MAKTFYENIQNLSENERYRLSRQFDKYIHVPVVDSKEICHPWSGARDSNGYGEIRIQFRGRRVHLKAHRVIFAQANPVAYNLAPSNDVSHLCHNRQCVNLHHLSFEPHTINNNRLVCKNSGECFSHHGFSDCLI